MRIGRPALVLVVVVAMLAVGEARPFHGPFDGWSARRRGCRGNRRPGPADPGSQCPESVPGKGKMVREYNLEIRKKSSTTAAAPHGLPDYNGSVPGPTLRVKTGEILRVRLTNHLNRVHTFHSHMQYYPIESDLSGQHYQQQRHGSHGPSRRNLHL